MDEGGGFTDEQFDLMIEDIRHRGDDGDDQEVDTTRPFQPGSASTPYHGGEEHEMQTMMREQSGLPDTSYEETPLLRRVRSISNLQKESELRQKMKKAVDMVKGKFPRVDLENVKVRRGTGKNSGKIVAIGIKGGEYKSLKDDESGLTKSFLDRFKEKLGPRAEELIVEDRDTIQEQLQREADADKQLEQANALVAEREKEAQEMQNLRQQIERTQARIDAIQEEYGSNFESESELNRLKQLKKKLSNRN